MDEYWLKKFPLRLPFMTDGEKWFAWQSAYTDAFDKHFILNGCVWDRLRMYTRHDGNFLYKMYSSADLAITDLEQAVKESI